MINGLLEKQAQLPSSIPLLRYGPDRPRFPWRDWNPALVQSAADLPPYLVMGWLDYRTFERSDGGWFARWQGTEDDTCFEVRYKAQPRQWEIRQTWCGLDGGFALFPAHMPLDQVIGQSLYLQFPQSWDTAAKERLQSAYQVRIVEPPENTYSFFGIPDGAFKTIAFPVAVRNLRPVQQWLEGIIDQSPPTYPVAVEARQVLQAINYVEGKAPGWTSEQLLCFNQSVVETGLVPHGLPVREVAVDGSTAWTLRRDIYFVFIRVPFAGLTDFLRRVATINGPIRTPRAGWACQHLPERQSGQP